MNNVNFTGELTSTKNRSTPQTGNVWNPKQYYTDKVIQSDFQNYYHGLSEWQAYDSSQKQKSKELQPRNGNLCTMIPTQDELGPKILNNGNGLKQQQRMTYHKKLQNILDITDQSKHYRKYKSYDAVKP
jgi:hypothetical protein